MGRSTRGLFRPASWLVALLLIAACTSGTTPPTLATGTTPPPSTTTSTSSTTTTTSTTATTTTTTTQAVDARFAEIEAMASATLVGWLRSIYFEDKVALLDWAGSEAMYLRGVQAIDEGLVAFVAEPTAQNSSVSLEEVLIDRPDCVAGRIQQATASVDEELEPLIQVWFPVDGRLEIATQWGAATNVGTLTEDCDLIIRDWQP